MRSNHKVAKLADEYLKNIVKLHGIPTSIVCDRDPKFTSRFWRALNMALGTKVCVSTAYHPQTDGKTERTIQTLEDMLRACVLDSGGRWEDRSSRNWYQIEEEVALNIFRVGRKSFR